MQQWITATKLHLYTYGSIPIAYHIRSRQTIPGTHKHKPHQFLCAAGPHQAALWSCPCDHPQPAPPHLSQMPWFLQSEEPVPAKHGSKHNYLHLYSNTEQAIYNCLTVSITHTSPHQYIPPFDHGEASGTLQPPLNPRMSSPTYIYIHKIYVRTMHVN